jgi:hypothetical protein
VAEGASGLRIGSGGVERLGSSVLLRSLPSPRRRAEQGSHVRLVSFPVECADLPVPLLPEKHPKFKGGLFGSGAVRHAGRVWMILSARSNEAQ